MGCSEQRHIKRASQTGRKAWTLYLGSPRREVRLIEYSVFEEDSGR